MIHTRGFIYHWQHTQNHYPNIAHKIAEQSPKRGGGGGGGGAEKRKANEADFDQ
jgi:hypothetical protein